MNIWTTDQGITAVIIYVCIIILVMCAAAVLFVPDISVMTCITIAAVSFVSFLVTVIARSK